MELFRGVLSSTVQRFARAELNLRATAA